MDQPRHGLSDHQWDTLSSLGLFPPTGHRGRSWKDHRRVLDGTLWILHTGSPWRDLPPYFGRWKTVHRRIRRWLRSRGIGIVIPTKKGQRRRRFDKARYKGRNAVERLIGWLRERRRLATRFEKLAVNFVAMIKLAMIEKFLAVLL